MDVAKKKQQQKKFHWTPCDFFVIGFGSVYNI